jgi:uncharacterized protein (DUF488 family)
MRHADATPGPPAGGPDPGFYTLGHSTRTLAELLALLRERGVRTLVDVRRFPGSRRHRHFNREPLAAALGEAGIEYRHEPDLGGRRSARADSPNTAWRVEGFRAYADHMATPEFHAALDRLLGAETRRPAALLCAEAVPWRCHRQLIADALVAHGHAVRHILAPERTQEHELNPAARVLPGGRLVYPAPGDDQLPLI